jgi:hypothetical protein
MMPPGSEYFHQGRLSSTSHRARSRKRPTTLILGWTLLLISGCSHHSEKESHRKVLELDQALSIRLGKASQADIFLLMGEPTSRELIGEAEVWLYQYGTDDRPIKPELKVVAPMHDELILSFDRGRMLHRYTVIIEGHAMKRERSR